jgi:DNA-binding response OmpR family regulator
LAFTGNFQATSGLSIHLGTREVRRGTSKIELTRTEYVLLELLMRNAGRVLTRESLIESVWGGDSEIESNTLDAFTRLLRGIHRVQGCPPSDPERRLAAAGFAVKRIRQFPSDASRTRSCH